MAELLESWGKDKYNRILYELGKGWACLAGFKKALANRILRSQRFGDHENLYWLYEKFTALNPPKEWKEKLAPLMTELKEFESKKAKEKEGINFYPKKAFETGILSIIKEEWNHKNNYCIF